MRNIFDDIIAIVSLCEICQAAKQKERQENLGKKYKPPEDYISPLAAMRAKKTMLKNEEEYKKTLERLEKGEKMIEEKGGFFKAPPLWVKGFQQLANEVLLYELEHDLILTQK